MVKRALVVTMVFALLAVVPFRADAHSDGVRCDEGVGPVLPLVLDGPVGDYVHCHDSGQLESGEHWYTGAVYAQVPGLAHAGVCTDTDSPLPANLRLSPFAGTGDPERQSMEAQGCDPASYIQVQDFEFDPVAVAIPPGEELRFKNDGPSVHTSTRGPDAVMGWESGELQPGEAFFTSLAVAGTYSYGCTIHPEMAGEIWVIVDVAPPSGARGDTFTVTVATESRPPDVVSDLEVRDPDGVRQEIAGITGPSVELTLSDEGTYFVRAQARDATTGVESGWSPATAIEVS